MAEEIVPVLREVGIETATLTLTHPISFIKTLIQLGHEPLPAYKAKQWAFWKEGLFRPGAFRYAWHIKDQDGCYGLFRGLSPRLTSTFMYNYSRKFMDEQLATCEKLQSEEPSPKDTWEDGMHKVGKKIMKNSLAESAAILISHPFQVLAVRSMAQFISREEAYESIIGGFLEIKDTQEGIAGFFKGVQPRLVGAVIAIALAETLSFAISKYIDSADEEVKEQNKDLFDMMIKHCSLVSSVITSSFTYPFTLCSTIMCTSGSRLASRTSFTCWTDCLKELKALKVHNRGSSIFLGRKVVGSVEALAAAFAGGLLFLL